MTQPDSQAPHGRDGNGVPLAPYGLNLDGTPRKSNRGARAGQKKGAGPATARKATTTPQAVMSNLSDSDRKGMLCELADMMVVTPLASASQIPFLAGRIGSRQADALAGDAFILAQYFPGIADGLILLSKTKPATLAWLDKAEANAPYLVLANALLQAGKAVAENHFNPNPRVAQAGRSLAAMKVAAMAEAVNAQAAAMAGEQADREMNAEMFERAAYDRATQNDPTVQFATA
jgi:hypothetical protein